MTAGVDRALRFVNDGPITITNPDPPPFGTDFTGPFLVSVDGPGDSDRYGVWRLFDLSAFPTITPVTTRLINHSAESWRHFNIGDPLLGAPPVFLSRVPNDFGVPLSVAGFGTDVSYIANNPHIGLQAIAMQNMTTNFAAVPQVDGTLLGTYRGVTTLKDKVLALRQDGSTNQLVMANAQLQGLLDVFPVPGNARPSTITGLANWPSRAAFEAEQTQPIDLAVVPHNAGIAVVPIDVAANRFASDLLAGGPADIRTPGGSPQAAIGDRDTQLLFVADGTAGLTIVDLAVPTGRRDDDANGIDDRVLGLLDLGGARAQGVAAWRDGSRVLKTAIAAGASGVSILEVLPPDRFDDIAQPAPPVTATIQISEVENLYKPVDGRAQYIPGYKSEDDLGRIYTNRRFNSDDPLRPEWTREDDYVILTAEISTSGNEPVCGLAVRWEIEDPDDPSDAQAHEDYKLLLDCNGDDGDDNSYNCEPDIFKRTPRWQSMPGSRLWHLETGGPNPVAVTSVHRDATGNLVSRVRLNSTDIGGDNFIVRATALEGGTPLGEPDQTGVMTVWKLIDVEYGHMPSALPINTDDVFAAFEPGFLHYQLSHGPHVTQPYDSWFPQAPPEVPGDVRYLVSPDELDWAKMPNFEQIEEKGWFFLAGAMEKWPRPCSQVVYPQPTELSNSNAATQVTGWGLALVYVAAHEDEVLTVQIARPEPTGDVVVVVRDSADAVIGEANGAPEAALAIQERNGSALCGHVSLEYGGDTITEIRLSMRGPSERLDGTRIQIPPGTHLPPFVTAGLATNLTMRVWQPGEPTNYVPMRGVVTTQDPGIFQVPAKSYWRVAPVEEAFFDLGQLFGSEWPIETADVHITLVNPTLGEAGKLGETMPAAGPDSLGIQATGRSIVYTLEADPNGTHDTVQTAIHELGHATGLQHRCGNLSHMGDEACASNDGDELVKTVQGTFKEWSAQNHGRSFCAEHLRALREIQHDEASITLDLGF